MAFAGVCGALWRKWRMAHGAWLWRGAARRDALGPLQEAVGVGGWGRAVAVRDGGWRWCLRRMGGWRRGGGFSWVLWGGFGFVFAFLSLRGAWGGGGVEEGVGVLIVCSSKKGNGDKEISRSYCPDVNVGLLNVYTSTSGW